MRIDKINLSWFRGAAECGVLDTKSKSVVIYGANGSGKSTFPDAVEYVVMDGKVKHLTHEYSGRRQEKGIRNTHAPDGKNSTISIHFQSGDTIDAKITTRGIPSFKSSPKELIGRVQCWKLEHLILRQDEVANFISKTKGRKYSVLLPLLGLENMESVAENLNNLEQTMLKRSGLPEKKEGLEKLKNKARKCLPGLSEEKVTRVLESLAKTYGADRMPREFLESVRIVKSAIERKINSMELETARHILLKQIHDESLADKLAETTRTEKDAKKEVDVMLDRRIGVLEKASVFAGDLGTDEKEIKCPACGQKIVAKEFVDHVCNELKDLKKARSARKKAIKARKVLALSLQGVRKNIRDDNISAWLSDTAQKELKDAFNRLFKIDLNKWEEGWSPEEISELNKTIPIVASLIEAATKMAPPATKKLLEDNEMIEAIESLSEIDSLASDIDRIQNIIQAIAASKRAIRNALKSQTKKTVKKISRDVRKLWSELHPDERIEDIKLYVPKDGDKAIDIGLKFFGVEQPSPRLTLSEGHRNSLGLCIFVALAQIDKNEDRPIVLDDVVSSFDREHRGMLVDVLLKYLANRQILLFTHDREWFAELRVRLSHADWEFKVLRPWENPKRGLQWSDSSYTFDDARVLIDENPEAAGNRVRAIMDTQLSIRAEKLRILMPYARGDRNDHRTCVDFLRYIISEAKTRLRKKDGKSFEYPEPIKDWKEAHKLLIAWADRGSHRGSLTRNEVNKLIEVCERALEHFRCGSCNDYIWISDQTTRKRLQCSCGEMQWRYK